MNIKFTDCWDANTERLVIGYAICGRENCDALARTVRPSDFWLPLHETIWRVMGRLRAVDFMIVSRTMGLGGEDVQIELARCIAMWARYSGQLSDVWEDRLWKGENTANLPDYNGLALKLAKQIHALATMRRVGLGLEKILHQAFAT